MAITNPRVTYDIASGRSPVTGDIAMQYNAQRDIDEYAIYDGTAWRIMQYSNTTITNIPSPNGNYTAVSNAAGHIKHDVVTMLENNLRVAEIYDSMTLKLKRTELQYRDGPGSMWTPIQRTKLYE